MKFSKVLKELVKEDQIGLSSLASAELVELFSTIMKASTVVSEWRLPLLSGFGVIIYNKPIKESLGGSDLAEFRSQLRMSPSRIKGKRIVTFAEVLLISVNFKFYVHLLKNAFTLLRYQLTAL